MAGVGSAGGEEEQVEGETAGQRHVEGWVLRCWGGAERCWADTAPELLPQRSRHGIGTYAESARHFSSNNNIANRLNRHNKFCFALNADLLLCNVIFVSAQLLLVKITLC